MCNFVSNEKVIELLLAGELTAEAEQILEEIKQHADDRISTKKLSTKARNKPGICLITAKVKSLCLASNKDYFHRLHWNSIRKCQHQSILQTSKNQGDRIVRFHQHINGMRKEVEAQRKRFSFKSYLEQTAKHELDGATKAFKTHEFFKAQEVELDTTIDQRTSDITKLCEQVDKTLTLRWKAYTTQISVLMRLARIQEKRLFKIGSIISAFSIINSDRRDDLLLDCVGDEYAANVETYQEDMEIAEKAVEYLKLDEL